MLNKNISLQWKCTRIIQKILIIKDKHRLTVYLRLNLNDRFEVMSDLRFI